MMRFRELLTGKIEEPVMASDSLAKLREMTKYLIDLEGEKQAALNDLELERLQLRSLFDSINEPIHVSHPANHRVLYANKSAQEIYGNDIVGKNCYEVFHDQETVCSFCPDEHILGENMGQTYIWEYHSRKHDRWYRCIDRAIYWPDGNGGQLVRFQLAVNITEQKQAEAALRQYSEHLEEMVEQRTKELQDAQEKIVHQKKLEVLGQLSDGVGHDLLNPLGAIKNVAYFLNMVLEESDPEIREMLEILEKEVVRSEKIINSLLDFAQPRAGIKHQANVNDVLQGMLTRVTIPENIEVVIQLDGTLPDVMIDPDQMEQVFENIILNSIESMPNGGQLVIRSRMEGSEWEVVSFSDTGSGISDENIDKLFQPLFTTKAKGVGLGLTVAKALMDGHNGNIEVQTELEKGSTFTISMPFSEVK
ncbi:nitrogen regulation protein NR(II) [Candidatus Poribacteria bacterium]